MQREERGLEIHGDKTDESLLLQTSIFYITSKGRILYIGEFSEKIGQDPYLFSKAKDKDTTTLIMTSQVIMTCSTPF